VNFTAFLASNLIAQFSRQIVVQILDLESPKVCWNLAVCTLENSAAWVELRGKSHKMSKKKLKNTFFTRERSSKGLLFTLLLFFFLFLLLLLG
jgi:hypothetical protein